MCPCCIKQAGSQNELICLQFTDTQTLLSPMSLFHYKQIDNPLSSAVGDLPSSELLLEIGIRSPQAEQGVCEVV